MNLPLGVDGRTWPVSVGQPSIRSTTAAQSDDEARGRRRADVPHVAIPPRATGGLPGWTWSWCHPGQGMAQGNAAALESAKSSTNSGSERSGPDLGAPESSEPGVSGVKRCGRFVPRVICCLPCSHCRRRCPQEVASSPTCQRRIAPPPARPCPPPAFRLSSARSRRGTAEFPIAYPFHQQIQTKEPDGASRANPGGLNELHRLMLKDAFKQARRIQGRLRQQQSL